MLTIREVYDASRRRRPHHAEAAEEAALAAVEAAEGGHWTEALARARQASELDPVWGDLRTTAERLAVEHVVALAARDDLAHADLCACNRCVGQYEAAWEAALADAAEAAGLRARAVLVTSYSGPAAHDAGACDDDCDCGGLWQAAHNRVLWTQEHD